MSWGRTLSVVNICALSLCIFGLYVSFVSNIPPSTNGTSISDGTYCNYTCNYTERCTMAINCTSCDTSGLPGLDVFIVRTVDTCLGSPGGHHILGWEFQKMVMSVDGCLSKQLYVQSVNIHVMVCVIVIMSLVAIKIILDDDM